jgi:hypothetical protein
MIAVESILFQLCLILSSKVAERLPKAESQVSNVELPACIIEKQAISRMN